MCKETQIENEMLRQQVQRREQIISELEKKIKDEETRMDHIAILDEINKDWAADAEDRIGGKLSHDKMKFI